MPEDVAFISSKSGVNTRRDRKVMSAARMDGQTDRQTDQTDGFSALYSKLYFAKKMILCVCVCVCWSNWYQHSNDEMIKMSA